MERLCRANLTPIGLLGLADTPRESAAELLAELARRGIGVRLITGGHPLTATVITTELGLGVTQDQVITDGALRPVRRSISGIARDRAIRLASASWVSISWRLASGSKRSI